MFGFPPFFCFSEDKRMLPSVAQGQEWPTSTSWSGRPALTRPVTQRPRKGRPKWAGHVSDDAKELETCGNHGKNQLSCKTVSFWSMVIGFFIFWPHQWHSHKCWANLGGWRKWPQQNWSAFWKTGWTIFCQIKLPIFRCIQMYTGYKFPTRWCPLDS